MKSEEQARDWLDGKKYPNRVELRTIVCNLLTDHEADKTTAIKQLETIIEDQKNTYLSSKLYWETENAKLKTDHEAAIKKAVEDERERVRGVLRAMYQEHRERNAYYNLAIMDAFAAIRSRSQSQREAE